jgi:hypothetical protein
LCRADSDDPAGAKGALFCPVVSLASSEDREKLACLVHLVSWYLPPKRNELTSSLAGRVARCFTALSEPQTAVAAEEESVKSET